MEMNPYYIEPVTIQNRIARVHKNKTLNEADIIEWSAECITEYIEDWDSFVPYKNIPLYADKNKRFYLPCLVYRVMDVHDGSGGRIAYEKHAGYIKTRSNNYDTIYIDYVGIPVTDEGTLLISNNHAQAVEAFIIDKLYYEDYLMGKLHPNMYQTIQLKLENELAASKVSFKHFDQGRMDTLSAIRGNMVPEIARTPLFQLYNTAQK